MFAIPGKRGYTTTFQGTANPISESSLWRCGATTGLDWSDIQIAGGLAYGTQTGNSGTFNDSVACASGIGSWRSNQMAEGTVKSINQQTGTCYCEVELWLRCTISAHVCKGYEINFRCNHDGSQYIGIVVWHGPFGGVGVQFDQIGTNDTGPGIYDGDSVRATIVDNVITAYIDHHDGNGFVQVSTRTDVNREHTSGAPGFGHWLHLNGAVGVNLTDYGFTSFTARDL